MRKQKIAIQYEVQYIAKDGTKWDGEFQCKQYEKLLADPSPLKKLKFFNDKGEPIDVFALKRIPMFCYLILTDNLPDYDWEVVRAIIGDTHGHEDCYRLPRYKGVWCNNWTNAYSGGYGHNGWEKTLPIYELENRIKHYQETIELLKKITETS